MNARARRLQTDIADLQEKVAVLQNQINQHRDELAGIAMEIFDLNGRQVRFATESNSYFVRIYIDELVMYGAFIRTAAEARYAAELIARECGITDNGTCVLIARRLRQVTWAGR